MRAFLAAVIIAPLLVIVGFSAPAAADTVARLEWTEPSTEAAFAGEWTAVLSTAMVYVGGQQPLQAGFGTVDVYMDGGAAPWAVALPIQADGSVFVSQQTNQPLLVPGVHQLTAVFTPVGNSPVGSATSGTAFALTITELAASASVELDTDGPQPVITTHLSGAYLDAMDAAPPGVWTFELAGPRGPTVWATSIAQSDVKDDLVVTVDAELKPGTEYTLSASFEPVAELREGVPVSGPEPVVFSTPPAGLVGALGSMVGVPAWAFVAMGVGLAALVAALVVLTLRLRRARSGEPAQRGLPSAREIEEHR